MTDVRRVLLTARRSRAPSVSPSSVAWSFSKALNVPANILSFGKLRVAYGEAGTEPLPYFTSPIYNSGSILLTPISQGTGLSPSQGGRGGLYTWIVKAADRLLPERTKEFETGFDLGLYRDKADISFTFYNAITQKAPEAPVRKQPYGRRASDVPLHRNLGELDRLPIEQQLIPANRDSADADVERALVEVGARHHTGARVQELAVA